MQNTGDIKINNPAIDKMFKAGAHFGYSKSRRHPSVKGLIFATKNQTDIIDLDKTEKMLEEAKAFAHNLGSQNKTLLLVGSKPECREIVKTIANTIDLPYVVERWVGGLLTNWSEMKKKITELENYRKENAEGGMAKYTKKEKMLILEKMDKLEKFYGGIMSLKKLPDALFIIDVKNDSIAYEEARALNIPMIALANSDSNINNIDYPIVANDAASPSITLFTSAIVEAYKEGLNTSTKKE